MMRYPVTSRRSVIDCPVHHFSVAVGDDGRIASRCPGCKRLVRLALRRWRQRARRAVAVG